MTSRPPPAKDSMDAARIINTVMTTIILTGAACLCAWDIGRQVCQLIQAHAVPTSDQLWRLLSPTGLLGMTLVFGLDLCAARRK